MILWPCTWSISIPSAPTWPESVASHFPVGTLREICRSDCSCKRLRSRKNGCCAERTCSSRPPIGTCGGRGCDGLRHHHRSGGSRPTLDPDQAILRVQRRVWGTREHADLSCLHRHAGHVAGDEPPGV